MNKFLSLLFLIACSAQADIIIVNQNDPDEGLNDPSERTPIGGNTGETLGEQRLNVLFEAARILNESLDIKYDVHVGSQFTVLPCSGDGTVLGQAGASDYYLDYSNGSVVPYALANHILDRDLNGSGLEIDTQFNSALDNQNGCTAGLSWYYGFDSAPDDGTSFLSVVLHEIVHGMGFIGLMGSSAHAPFSWPDGKEGFSLLSKNLGRAGLSATLDEMTRGQRIIAMTSGDRLTWKGDSANNKTSNYSSGVNQNEIQFYAPSSFDSGSSLSHFDVDLAPDELMEPIYTDTFSDIGLSLEVLIDIGWSPNPDNLPNYPPEFTEVPTQSTTEDTSFDVELSATDINDDELTYNVSSVSAGLSASVSGATLTVSPDENFFGEGSVTASVYDGENTVTTSFSVTVTPVNDEPAISEVADVTFPEGDTASLTISVSDVDNAMNELSVTATTTNTELGMTLSDKEISFTPDENYFGQGVVTVTVSDGDKQSSLSFNVTITNINDEPVLLTESHQTLTEDTPLTLTLTAVDLDGDALTYSILANRLGVSATITDAELTITPDENFNGSSTVTVIVSDGLADSGTAISLTVMPENDEPVLNDIANRSFEQASGATIALSGSDVDGDALSFSAQSLNPELVTATVEGTILTLAAADEFNGSGTVSVTISDGELTDTKTFIATVTDGTEPSPLSIKVNDQLIVSGASVALDSLAAVQLDASGGNGQYSFEVFYQGDRPDLLEGENGSRELTLPTIGAFAGDYLITIDDGLASVDEATVTLSRPLLLTTSVTPVMAGSTQAKLVAAGGTVGSDVTFSINGDEVPEGSIAPGFADNEGDTITTATATDNSAANNPASVFINAIGASPGTYSVEAALSSAPTASIDLEVVSQNLVAFSVTDNTDSGLEALITVDDERTTAWGIQQTMTTANDGSAELTLPDTSLNLIVSKRGYNSELIEYEGGAEVNVTLEVSDGYYFLTGSITAEGFGFNASLPELVMTMSDSSEETINAVSLSSDIAQFEWTGDISEVSPQLLKVSHPSANPVEVSLRPDLGEQDLDITLVASPVDPAPGNGASDSDGGSGGGNAAWLLVTALALIGRRRLKTS
jgi:hypothetical protein